MFVKNGLIGAQINMRIAICDDDSTFTTKIRISMDEYFARKNLQADYYIFTSPKRLLEFDISNIQALFLDIDMPELNGIELARQLRTKNLDLIIVFVTDFIEYAPYGYRVEAFRYLLKNRLDMELHLTLDEVVDKLYSEQATIEIRVEGETEKLLLKDIVYIEGTGHRAVLIHTRGRSSPLECSGKLSCFEQELRERGFLRLQRSYLANMNCIKRISGYKAIFKDGTELKVSDQGYRDIVGKFVSWKGQQM